MPWPPHREELRRGPEEGRTPLKVQILLCERAWEGKGNGAEQQLAGGWHWWGRKQHLQPPVLALLGWGFVLGVCTPSCCSAPPSPDPSPGVRGSTRLCPLSAEKSRRSSAPWHAASPRRARAEPAAGTQTPSSAFRLQVVGGGAARARRAVPAFPRGRARRPRARGAASRGSRAAAPSPPWPQPQILALPAPGALQAARWWCRRCHMGPICSLPHFHICGAQQQLRVLGEGWV